MRTTTKFVGFLFTFSMLMMMMMFDLTNCNFPNRDIEIQEKQQIVTINNDFYPIYESIYENEVFRPILAFLQQPNCSQLYENPFLQNLPILPLQVEIWSNEIENQIKWQLSLEKREFCRVNNLTIKFDICYQNKLSLIPWSVKSIWLEFEEEQLLMVNLSSLTKINFSYKKYLPNIINFSLPILSSPSNCPSYIALLNQSSFLNTLNLVVKLNPNQQRNSNSSRPSSPQQPQSQPSSSAFPNVYITEESLKISSNLNHKLNLTKFDFISKEYVKLWSALTISNQIMNNTINNNISFSSINKIHKILEKWLCARDLSLELIKKMFPDDWNRKLYPFQVDKPLPDNATYCKIRNFTNMPNYNRNNYNQNPPYYYDPYGRPVYEPAYVLKFIIKNAPVAKLDKLIIPLTQSRNNKGI